MKIILYNFNTIKLRSLTNRSGTYFGFEKNLTKLRSGAFRYYYAIGYTENSKFKLLASRPRDNISILMKL